MTSSGADRAGVMPETAYGSCMAMTQPLLCPAVFWSHYDSTFVWRCRNADFFVDAGITLRIGRKFFFGAPRSEPSLSVDIQS